jgi:O-methyltransferase involved in polyketide biosynthesis
MATAAGMYDHYLGGTNHSAADAAAAEQVLAAALPGLPNASTSAWANRGFLQRAAGWLARQGINQFIDVGAGLPTQNNTHDVVRAVDPHARVAYVDNEPAAVSLGRQLLAGDDNAVYVQADLRDPDSILRQPDIRGLIDFERPVGLIVVGVLYFVPDEAEPHAAVARLVDALPSGSYLAICHATLDGWGEGMLASAGKSDEVYARTRSSVHYRDRAAVQRFFTGLEIVPPYPGGPAEVAHVGLWGAEDPGEADDDVGRMFYAAVARKP